MDKRKLTVETYGCSCEGGVEYGLIIKDADPNIMEGDDEIMEIITRDRDLPQPSNKEEAYNSSGKQDFTNELVRRFNHFPALVEALEEALSDLQSPDMGGLTGAEHDAGAAEGTIIKIRAALKTATE